MSEPTEVIDEITRAVVNGTDAFEYLSEVFDVPQGRLTEAERQALDTVKRITDTATFITNVTATPIDDAVMRLLGALPLEALAKLATAWRNWVRGINEGVITVDPAVSVGFSD